MLANDLLKGVRIIDYHLIKLIIYVSFCFMNLVFKSLQRSINVIATRAFK